MVRQRILVVEDDEAIREGVLDALSYAGFETLYAATGDLGRDMAVRVDCDLLLLDLVLPKVSGLEILTAVRAARPTLPVIIVTAKGSESERIEGLKLGADDYVVKPYSIKELLARIEAVLRRSPGRSLQIDLIPFPGGEIDLVRRELRFEDKNPARCELSEREVDLLRYLASHPGKAIARDELLANVWRIDPKGVATRTIDMHVARLREKLRDKNGDPQTLLTVRGKGYMLSQPEKA
jgi:DNA-binding response OmpR family regulator